MILLHHALDTLTLDWLLLALGYAVTPWALLELGTPPPTALAVPAHQAGWLPPA